MNTWLSRVALRGIRGLPPLEVHLQPMTALIGPRASGKSRVLAAISWLLTGAPELRAAPAGGQLLVEAQLESASGRRLIARGDDRSPGGDLPTVWFLTARDRLTQPPSRRSGRSDAAIAEEMVASIAERRLAGDEDRILLIEEPELMLTPHQQRHLYGILRRYAERNQVIYSTRAPALLDATYHHEIVRLDLTLRGLAVRQAPSDVLTDEERLRLRAEFDNERNEMFFANAVVLVEGQTERLALRPLFRRLGHDPDALGISIVEVGGKTNLPLVARVLSRLRIPYLIVHDADRGESAERENEVIRLSSAKAPVIRLDPDFEAEAGIRDQAEKVLAAWRRFSTIAQEDVPPVFRTLVETAVALATHEPAD